MHLKRINRRARWTGLGLCDSATLRLYDSVRGSVRLWVGEPNRTSSRELAATFYGSGSGMEEPNQRVTSRVGAPHTEREKNNNNKNNKKPNKIKDTRTQTGQFQVTSLWAYLALLNNFHNHETQLKLEPSHRAQFQAEMATCRRSPLAACRLPLAGRFATTNNLPRSGVSQVHFHFHFLAFFYPRYYESKGIQDFGWG